MITKVRFRLNQLMGHTSTTILNLFLVGRVYHSGLPLGPLIVAQLLHCWQGLAHPDQILLET
jgi:hypothetical protein